MTASKRRLHHAFEYYDPFTDQRVDPRHAEDLDQHPDLPGFLHDAVARAKRLTGPLTAAELSERAHQVDKLALDGQVATIQRLDSADTEGRNYVAATRPDCLQAALEHFDDVPAPATWPGLFGVLALRFAGEIVNGLWPEGGDARSDEDPYGRENPPIDKIRTEIAIDAVRAAAIGECLVWAARDAERREANRRNASKPRRGKEKLAEACISWFESLPTDGSYRYLRHAIDDFLETIKDRPDLSREVSENTHLFLARRVKAHFEAHAKPLPVGKRR